MPHFDPNATQTRTFEYRAAADTAKREISGVGVPLGVETEIFPGFREVFDQDCEFEGLERAKLKTHHRTLIGVISASSREAGKLNITGRASATRDGDEALALAADGALDSFSIGFRPLEYTRTDHDDGSMTIRHLRVRSNEFSLTDNPAYTDALVTDVREKNPTTEGAPVTDTITREDLDTLRAEMTEQHRSTQTALQLIGEREQPTCDTRSAGAVLQALVSGDQATTQRYSEIMERAYDGGTSADAPVKDAWVGDLTRIFDSATGILGEIFPAGTLPATGNNVEFAQLKSNTVTVEEQEKEGDDLPSGKVVLEVKSAPVKTYGGYVQLTRQQIERSTLPVLNRSLEAMAVAAGARKKAVLRAAYLELVAARKALAGNAGVLKLGALLDDATATLWTDLIIDAAVRYDKLSLPLEGMIVGTATFKHLNGLETNGKRVFKVAEDRGMIGTLNLPGLTGDLGGITVIGDPGRAAHVAEFFNSAAIKPYDSAVTQLQDENIINLSKSFSVYKYGAVAPEMPEALIPVEFAA